MFSYPETSLHRIVDVTKWNTRWKFVAIFGIFSILILLAWSNRFIQDDAYISFRYAENFSKGNGFVWNVGEAPIEGFTNFLWTFFISIGIYLGFEPVLFSYVLGISFFSITLFITYKLARLLLHSESLSLLTVILMGTNYSFSAYATGGLETIMQTCLLSAVAYLSIQILPESKWKVRNLLFISVLSSLAILTRIDSVIILAVVFVALFYRTFIATVNNNDKLIRVAALVLPVFLIVLVWFIWKYKTYGDILPNTFYVKVTSNSSILRGGFFLILFFLTYWFFPVMILSLFGIKWIVKNSRMNLAILMAIIGLWCMYIVYVGGDFMEFRLFISIMPFLFILLSWFIFGFVKKPIFRLALVAMIVAGSIYHALCFTTIRQIGCISELAGYMVRSDQNWPGIGRALGKYFQSEESPVTIAVRPAGAIPYYSKLRTIDMLGLNDRYIALNGLIVSSIPGHQREAPFEYILQSNVQLVIGHPVVSRRENVFKNIYSLDDLRMMFSIPDISADLMPTNAKVIDIPIDAQYKVTVLYLTQNTVVDRAIEENSFVTYPITLEKQAAQ